MEWVMLVPSVVFSRVKNNFDSELKTKYGMTDSNFSTVAVSDEDATFPFVFFKTLPATEVGRDLEGTEINGAIFTFEIQVTDNRFQKNAREVMSECLRIMKSMRFEAVSMPEINSTEDTHVAIARFRRVIGKGDGI